MLKWYEDGNSEEGHLGTASLGVEELGLGVRAWNCLRKEGIRTIGDLIARSPDDLLRIRNLGEGTLREIVDALGARGVRLSGDFTAYKEYVVRANQLQSDCSVGDLLSAEIRVLNLSARPSGCLRSIGVRTIRDLVGWTPHDLARTRNLGERTLEEIVEVLKKHGLSLGMDTSTVPVDESSVPVLMRSVDSLDLGTRASNCLRAAGVRTVGDLIGYSERQLLEVPHLGAGTVREIVDAVSAQGLRLRDSLHRLHQILRAGLQTVDEELEYVVSQVVAPRNRAVLMLRLGWSGQPVRTLKELAGNPKLSRLGRCVTRERVRQIESKGRQAIRRSLNGLCPRRVSDALGLVSESTPIAVDKVPKLLTERGLSHTGLGYSALSTIAELAQTPWKLVRLTSGASSVLVSTEERADYVAALKLLVSSRSQAFARVTDAVRGTSEPARAGILLTRLVDVHSEYRWLDRDAGLFWSAARDSNKILFQCRKLYSLADRLHLDEIHGAVQRTRTVSEMPPKHALREMLSQTDWFQIRENYVQLREGISFNTLSKQDHRLVLATRGMGRTVGFAEIRDNLVREGVSSNHAGQHLLFSPFLLRVARGRFRILFDVNGPRANAVRTAREAYPSATNGGDAKGSELREDGGSMKATVTTVEISSRALITDRVRVDAEVPGGRWIVVHGNEHVGHCTIGSGVVRQLAPALRNGGVRVGDRCRLRFDLDSRCVQVEIVASNQGCSST